MRWRMETTDREGEGEMATVAEIIAMVKAGETVRIPSKYVKLFMRECEVHNLTCSIYFSPEPKGIHALSLNPPSVEPPP